MKNLACLLAAAMALGCGGTIEDGPLTEACEALCAAKQSCGDESLTPQECVQSCVADVGTPGPDCETAITASGQCLENNCTDAAACTPELAARDQACGGTG